MKAVVIVLAVAATAASLRLTPDQIAADNLELDAAHDVELTPACASVECGEYSCPAPFELKTDGTCCGYCYAPDHVVPVDRHVKVPYNATGNAVAQCDSAPSTCKSPGVHPVRCFKPSCRVGDSPTCGANACCPRCTGAGGGVRIDQGAPLPTAAPEEPVRDAPHTAAPTEETAADEVVEPEKPVVVPVPAPSPPEQEPEPQTMREDSG